MQPTTARPVLVAEQAVGIEVVGDPLAQLDHDTGVEFGRVPHQRALGFCHLGGRDAGRQHVDRLAYGADVILTERARLHRGGNSASSGGTAGPVSERRGRIRAASLKRRTISLGVMRSRAHSISRTAGRHSLPSGGSAISAKNRYIRPRFVRSCVSNRSATSTRKLLPTTSELVSRST